MHLSSEGKQIVFKAGVVQLTKTSGKEKDECPHPCPNKETMFLAMGVSAASLR